MRTAHTPRETKLHSCARSEALACNSESVQSRAALFRQGHLPESSFYPLSLSLLYVRFRHQILADKVGRVQVNLWASLPPPSSFSSSLGQWKKVSAWAIEINRRLAPALAIYTRLGPRQQFSPLHWRRVAPPLARTFDRRDFIIKMNHKASPGSERANSLRPATSLMKQKLLRSWDGTSHICVYNWLRAS